MARQLLIVAHAPSDNTRALRDAVERGARSETAVGVRVVAPLQAGPDDVLAAQAVVRQVAVGPSVKRYIVALVEASRVRLREEEAWRPAWHPVEDLPPLAFNNERVIAQAVQRVGAKLDYTNIAYGLLPDLFTIRELQTTYEAILRRPLDRRNFRKRMLSTGIIEATDELRRRGVPAAALREFVARVGVARASHA